MEPGAGQPRRNGAGSRGPRTAEGKARSAQNALKHGLRAEKYVVLPEEDADEFAGLEAALIAELARLGALQTVLARRGAVAVWRLARADRLAAATGLGPGSQPGGQEADLFQERRYADGTLGLARIRDGNGTRSFETLLRYRGAAMAEFWRALRTLKALQAEQAADTGPALAAHPPDAHPKPSAERPSLARRAQPDEPEGGAGRRLEYAMHDQPPPGRTLHEPAAPWLPNEPDRGGGALCATDQPLPGRPLHEPVAPWLPSEPETDRLAASAPGGPRAEGTQAGRRRDGAPCRRAVGFARARMAAW